MVRILELCVRDSFQNRKTFRIDEKAAIISSRVEMSKDVEKALLMWFKTYRNSSVLITASLLQQKANEITKLVGKQFKCTESWIFQFRMRYNSVLGKITGKTNSINPEVCDDWLGKVWPHFREGDQEHEIYNMDETELFYKLMPYKTLKLKGKRCNGGKKFKKPNYSSSSSECGRNCLT